MLYIQSSWVLLDSFVFWAISYDATQRLLSGLGSAVSCPSPKLENNAVVGSWLVINISYVGAQVSSHPKLVNKSTFPIQCLNESAEFLAFLDFCSSTQAMNANSHSVEEKSKG